MSKKYETVKAVLTVWLWVTMTEDATIFNDDSPCCWCTTTALQKWSARSFWVRPSSPQRCRPVPPLAAVAHLGLGRTLDHSVGGPTQLFIDIRSGNIMVVLETTTPTESSSAVSSTTSSRMQSYYNSPYVQPLPHEVRFYHRNWFLGGTCLFIHSIFFTGLRFESKSLGYVDPGMQQDWI